jgi:2-polyprenyl-3-methyl-5-hydroxy-6-metoxy-1,4-benzoquinol methylase
MNICCPLCKSQSPIILEDINLKLLKELYLKFPVDIENIFLNYKKLELYRCQDCTLKFYYPSIVGSESFYKKVSTFDWYYLVDKEEYNLASTYIKEDDKVLEVGAGMGMFSKKIKSNDYTGLEISQSAIEKAKEKSISLSKEFIEDHSRRFYEKYDVVCSFQVLEHVFNPYEFLKNCLDSLKPNGLFIIAVPSEDSFLTYSVNQIFNLPPHHVTRWTDKSLNYIADVFKLKIINIHHEQLQNIHLQWYARTSAFIILSKIFNYKIKSIDDSVGFKILDKISSYFGNLILKGLKKETLPYGQTVLAVYRKTG